MENNDEIGRSEIERLEKLELIINEFRIASAGDGSVLGGFGKLPKNQSQLSFQERLSNVRQARLKFGFDGHNVDVSGTFIDGFTAT